MTDLAAYLDQIVGHSPLTYLPNPFPEPVPIQLYLKRDDLLHPLVSGNKWRKLKYNLLAAQAQGFDGPPRGTLLTFGGAYSNHLYATAAAGTLFGFQTIGIVRGDELANLPLNSTLTFCREQGMRLVFVDRDTYRRKTEQTYLNELQKQFGPFYHVPEGGTNELAVHGTAEILPEVVEQLDGRPLHTIACAVGTAGTLAGLIASAPASVNVLGVSALKGAINFPILPGTAPRGRNRAADRAEPGPSADWLPANVSIRTDYHFGGYGRTTPALLSFMAAFEARTGISLESTYTGKLLYAIYDLARQGYFPDGSTVVAVHTGGLQAW